MASRRFSDKPWRFWKSHLDPCYITEVYSISAFPGPCCGNWKQILPQRVPDPGPWSCGCLCPSEFMGEVSVLQPHVQTMIPPSFGCSSEYRRETCDGDLSVPTRASSESCVGTSHVYFLYLERINAVKVRPCYGLMVLLVTCLTRIW